MSSDVRSTAGSGSQAAEMVPAILDERAHRACGVDGGSASWSVQGTQVSGDSTKPGVQLDSSAALCLRS